MLVDGRELTNSLYELAQYAVGARQITTEGLLTVLGQINESLDNIRHCIDHTYYVVSRYVTIRLNYFKLAAMLPLSVMAQSVTYNHDESVMNQFTIGETGAGSFTPDWYYDVLHKNFSIQP